MNNTVNETTRRSLTVNLRNLQTQPSNAWVRQTKCMLTSVAVKDVTALPDSRIPVRKLLNLISLPTMSGKFNSLVSIISILATLTVGGGTVYASNVAKPGDLLFPLDKTVEQVQRIFTTRQASIANLELDVMDERLSELAALASSNDISALSQAITEVETQTGVVAEQLAIMDQLREQNKLQTQEQQQILERLRLRVQEQTAVMQQTQSRIKSEGDTVNSGNLQQIEGRYSGSVETKIQGFEEETGVKISTEQSQQNQGEDTKIQNQNQIQNQGESRGGSGLGNGQDSDSGSGNGTQQKGR